jgi:uncharacterized protein YaiL (DUF2058 family)
MQSLRDKLLKAGLVTEQQAKDSERQQKEPKRPKQAPASFKQRQQAETEEERQRREAFAAREAEQAEERRREAAKKEEARQQSERALTIRQLVASHRLRDALGDVNFHFVRRSGKIGRVAVKQEIADQLEQGALAVVEDPGNPEHAVVPRDAALRIRKVDPAAVRFFSGPDAAVGFQAEAPPAVPPEAPADEA